MSVFRKHFCPILGWASVIALLTFPFFSASGAFDMFLKIGSIEGESNGDIKGNHAKEIDVLAWSWGMSNSGTAISGPGTANVQDISFTKYLDKSTPTLMLAALTGSSFASAEFTVSQNNTKTPYEMLKLKLENVLVTSVSAGGSGGQERLTENVSLNFSKVSLEYYVQDALTGKASKAGEFTYYVSAVK